ncbi:hypothetical protein GLAREA_02620 [Glarea lozoyensis ATCC 20868]|uniref:Uncharacterized protein n=1 Tax=Glarea lozoyensis (strain ATCC 20868 / MF5171) TaxID=1116229 RepID=S3CJL4_GLAL2|nr:uncharacterized protein GLAREA_02620 [Glarea lozoyensis ATCC 20868]EPE26707.1 hypothetical protein GLAREA_02620 [Glarea lozoyensis ATCC 20868]
MSRTASPVYAPGTWQNTLQTYQTLRRIRESPCAELTIIFPCTHKLENLRGCRACMLAHKHETLQPCKKFHAEVIYPREICPDCTHAEIGRQRAAMEEETRLRRRQERAAEERRKEVLKRQLNEAGWKRGEGNFF